MAMAMRFNTDTFVSWIRIQAPGSRMKKHLAIETRQTPIEKLAKCYSHHADREWRFARATARGFEYR